MIHPTRFGTATPRFQITIGAGEVGATMTDFPVMVDLSLMPSGFWTDVNHDGGRDFDATLMLAREPISRSALHRALWRYPLMTLQVVAAIHWHAFIIWCKQNPVYDHPGKSKAAP